MKGRGRRAAVIAGAGASLVLVASATAFRDPLLEEWHLHRFRTGGEEARKSALAWMADHGAVKSWRAILESQIAGFPEILLIQRLSKGLVQADFAPAALSRFEGRARGWIASSGNQARLADAEKAIRERIGEAPWTRTAEKFMLDGEVSPRLRVFMARMCMIRIEDQELRTATLRILRTALADPDPYVRAGAAYGLADAGPRGRDSLSAIEALEADPDEVVREAAEISAARLRDAGQREAEEAAR